MKKIKLWFVDKWENNRVEFIIQCIACVMAILVLMIGLSVPSSAAESSEDQFLVSSGVYKFNDTISAESLGTIDLEFTSNWTYQFKDYTTNCSSINIYLNNGNVNVSFYVTYMSPSISSFTPPAGFVAYQNVWLDNYYNGVDTIIVNSDQYLSEEQYNLFNSIATLQEDSPTNTLPSVGNVIPAGVYTFNDVLTVPSDINISASFEYPNEYPSFTLYFDGEYHSYYLHELYFDSYNDGFIMQYKTVMNGSASILNYYNSTESGTSNYPNHWYFTAGRVLTFSKDATVSPEFYSWFAQNVTIGDSDPNVPSDPDSPGGDISDIGKVPGMFFESIFEGLSGIQFWPGFSLMDILSAVLGLFTIIWLLKLVAGG